MNKRDAVMNVAAGDRQDGYIPAAFFLHFDPECHAGPAAVAKHLEFFRATNMDLLKIQYERKFPSWPGIKTPTDWANVPLLDLDFFEPQLSVVRGLVQAAKPEALVVHTLYSPFMCAGHVGGPDVLAAHIAQDPDAVNKGMERITQSLMLFVRECVKIGLDGFYHSTQGAETGRLASPELFERCVKPFDLAVMEEIAESCQFNILHVCDYHGAYDTVEATLNYPGHVVNVNPHIGGREYTGAEIAGMFGRPFMGGMDRLGVLANGTEEEVRAEARRVLADAPTPTILAADCTVPPGTPWQHLAAAIDEAHHWGG